MTKLYNTVKFLLIWAGVPFIIYLLYYVAQQNDTAKGGILGVSFVVWSIVAYGIYRGLK